MTTPTLITPACPDCLRIEAEEIAGESHRAGCASHLRAEAEELAHAIAISPGLYRHSIGADERIFTRHGLSEYRVTDFVPESELTAYQAYMWGWNMAADRPNTKAEAEAKPAVAAPTEEFCPRCDAPLLPTPDGVTWTSSNCTEDDPDGFGEAERHAEAMAALSEALGAETRRHAAKVAELLGTSEP
jgi:hypothetical protein